MQQTNISSNHDTDYNVGFHKGRGLIFEFGCPGNIPKEFVNAIEKQFENDVVNKSLKNGIYSVRLLGYSAETILIY